jgi:hypothetical protein
MFLRLLIGANEVTVRRSLLIGKPEFSSLPLPFLKKEGANTNRIAK